MYAIVLALSVSCFDAHWRYKNAALAYSWHVADFRQEERPRPEFLRTYRLGRYRAEEHGGTGKMRKERGY